MFFLKYYFGWQFHPDHVFIFSKLSNFHFIVAPAIKPAKKVASGTPADQGKASTSKRGQENEIIPPTSAAFKHFLQTTTSDEEEAPITAPQRPPSPAAFQQTTQQETVKSGTYWIFN